MEQKSKKKLIVIVIVAIVLVIGVAVGVRIYNDVKDQNEMEKHSEAIEAYNLTKVKDSVTIYIMEEVMNSNGTKSVEQVVAQLYTENGWASDAKEKLNLDEKIDLNKYRLTSAGTVEVK